MRTIWLHLQAPFAAFRWMQAGVWRATSPTIPPSAAWGLVLNLAGIEIRSTKPARTTLIRDDAPCLQIAVGEVTPPSRSVLYQQLHSYRVGSDKKTKALAARTHGAKYWIAPVRRELLVDLDVLLGVRALSDILLDRIVKGLDGRLDTPRYGLPFAGDNALLFDQIQVLPEPLAAHWYEPIAPTGEPRQGSCRLTVGIDRGDAAKTSSMLFAPTESTLAEPSSASWIWVPRRPTRPG